MLSPPQGVRPLGMGGAFAAVADDPNAAVSNPAGLARNVAGSLSWSQTRLSFDSREYLVLATARPLSTTAFGAALVLAQRSQDNVQDFRILLDANANPVIDPVTNLPQKEILGYYTRYSSQLGLALGLELGEFVAAGVAAKGSLINSGKDLAQGWGADAGVLLRTGPLRWAAVIQDLGTMPEALADGTTAVVPPALGLGMAWHVIPAAEKSGDGGENSGAWWQRPLLAVLQADGRLPWTFWPRARAGLEWLPVRNLALRMGTDSQRFDLGVSLRITRIQIDYAAVGGDLSQSNRVAVRYDF